MPTPKVFVAPQHTLNTTVLTAPPLSLTAAPRWVDRLYSALVVYAIVCTVLMLAGIGGKEVTHYVGLLSDGPSDLVATILAFTAARRTRPGTLRKAWKEAQCENLLCCGGAFVVSDCQPLCTITQTSSPRPS